MRTAHRSSVLVAGFLVVAGCGASEPSEGGTAGTGVVGTGGQGGGNTGGSSPGGRGGASGTAGTIGTGGAATGGRGGEAGGASGTGGTGIGGTGGASGGSGGAGGGSGGSVGSAGSVGTGGRGGGAGGAAGGSLGTGGRGGGAATGGRGGAAGGGTGGSAGATGQGGTGGSSSGTCTASKAASASASGSGPHKVTVETNSDTGIKEGTIFRPTDLGGTEKYPIFVWGEGACSLNGLSNSAAMGEIASHGYFVIADGTPNGTGNRSMTSDVVSMAKPLLAYVTWAIAENGKPCSAYYQSLDTTKIAANGFSCGGLMAEGTAGDPRITTWGLNSSGLTSANQAFYKTVHTPVLIVLGGSSDIAYQNGERDYTSIAALGIPIMLFSKDLGHGGDLFSSRGGDFTKIDLAWLNWQLKGDATATGKGVLVGASCTYCTNSAWEVKSMSIQ
jgi:dienelactone hydrolase